MLNDLVMNSVKILWLSISILQHEFDRKCRPLARKTCSARKIMFTILLKNTRPTDDAFYINYAYFLRHLEFVVIKLKEFELDLFLTVCTLRVCKLTGISQFELFASKLRACLMLANLKIYRQF